MQVAADALQNYTQKQRLAYSDAQERANQAEESIAASRQKERDTIADVAVKNATLYAAMQARADKQAETAVAVGQAAQAARLEAMSQYAAIDMERAARELAGTVQIEEMGKANSAIDSTAKNAAMSIAAGTAGVIASTARAASAASVAQAAAKVADEQAAQARQLIGRAQLAKDVADTANSEFGDLETAAKASEDAALRVAALAEEDRNRLKQAQDALQIMMQTAVDSRDAAQAQSSSAAGQLGSTAADAMRILAEVTANAGKVVRNETAKAAGVAAVINAKLAPPEAPFIGVQPAPQSSPCLGGTSLQALPCFMEATMRAVDQAVA